MLEISASMTQLNTRVYAILETHSIKEIGANIWRQRFHSVYENVRLRPSTRRRINGVFKFIHFGERFRIYAFTVSVFIVFVWPRPKRIKKFAFTSVCVYNRLRVDGALNYCTCRKWSQLSIASDPVRSRGIEWILGIDGECAENLNSA